MTQKLIENIENRKNTNIKNEKMQFIFIHIHHIAADEYDDGKKYC